MDKAKNNIENVGVFTTDKALKILSWNAVMEEMTGLSEKDVQNKSILSLFPEIEERNLHKKFENVINNGDVEILSSVLHKYLIKIPFPEEILGHQYMLQSVSIAPLFDESKIVGTIVTVKDVTKSRLNELINSYRERERKEKALSKAEVDELLKKLDHYDWKERKKAVETLKQSSSDILEDILVRIKQHHKNLNILNSAIQVLVGHREKIFDTLSHLLKSSDKDLRIYAAQTLGESKDMRAVPVLIEALDDPDKNVVYHAIESLGKLKAYEAVPRLIEIVLQNDFFTSFAAIDSLRNMGEKILLIHLDKLIENEFLQPICIEVIGEFGYDVNIPTLIEILKLNPETVFDLAEAIIKMMERYEKHYKEGNFIISSANKLLDTHTRQILINNLSKKNHPKFRYLVQLLTLLADQDELIHVFNLLKEPDLAKIILSNFIKRENKSAKLLIINLDKVTYEIKIELIKALGILVDKEAISVLLSFLDNEEEEILLASLYSLAMIGSAEAYEKIFSLLGHSSNAIRRAAIFALNSIGSPKMEDDILRLLFSENNFELDSAIRIAGYFGYPKCKDRIIELCDSENVKIRSLAIENICFFEAAHILSILDKASNDPSAECRIAAAKALAFVPENMSFKLAQKLLNDENSWVRINAIRTIGIQRFQNACKLILNFLEHEETVPVIITAIKVLPEICSEEAIPKLIELIKHENEDIVFATIETLSKIKHPSSLQALVENIYSPNPKIRKAILEALKSLKSENMVEIIKSYILSEEDLELKKLAVEVLANFQTESSCVSLFEISSERELKEFVIESLARQDKKLLHVFREILKGNKSELKISAIEALTLMKTEAATGLIIDSLDDESPMVRLYALNALRILNFHKAVDKIHYLAMNDVNPEVKILAEDLLKKIHGF